MKKALNLIFIYFTFLISGIIIGSVFYSFYLNVLKFIAGNEIYFFSREELLDSLFYVSYCMLFLICPLVCYYRVRHPGGFPQTVAYIILCLFTWLFLFTGVKQLNNYYIKHFEKENKTEYITKGYFREADGKVYYFTENFKYKAGQGIAANTVIIDTSEDGIVTVENTKESEEFILNKKAEPYREVQIKRTFEDNDFKFMFTFKVVLDYAASCLEDGLIAYLGFLSMALLICVLYGLTGFCEWRMLNTSMLFIGNSAILLFNSIFCRPVTQALRDRLTANSFFEMLGNYLNNPLLVVVNTVCALIILIASIINFIVRNHKKKNR